MALYLDSASLSDAQEAAGYGFVAGITTNPTLLAKETSAPFEHLKKMTAAFPGPVFYQLIASTPEEMVKEAWQAHAVAPGKIILKIPCNLNGLKVVSQMSPQVICAVTALFSVQQGWLAALAGARYVIPYVSRTERLGGTPLKLVENLSLLYREKPFSTEILAASVKTPEQALDTLLAGAHHLTIPLSLINELAEHAWSVQAVEDFSKSASDMKSAPPATPSLSENVRVPFDMLDYIIGKIQIEELFASNSQQDLKAYMAQRELEKLIEEDEITTRLEELKKKLGK
ncbi:transaldolase family protein [Candidatus Chlorohelix sp.]|uniref:transaldolase family protein n=1 Tax=Candidatus Chlorohelix sp. TaxID=3139201 RepID=UPI003047A340